LNHEQTTNGQHHATTSSGCAFLDIDIGTCYARADILSKTEAYHCRWFS